MGNFCVVPEERSYWAIRCEKGAFLRHFTVNGIVAIGHLDDLNLPSTKGRPFVAEWETIKQQLIHRFNDLDESPRSAYLVASQAKTFVENIKEGDWILALGAEMAVVGRVSSPSYVDKDPVYEKNANGFDAEMSFNLRRSVKWGPAIRRDEFSGALRRSLAANQTIFNLDEHWESIYHALYGSFYRDDILYFSARITTKSLVNNIDITSFLSILSDIEVLSLGLNNGINNKNFNDYFSEYYEKGQLSLTTKAEFHSPGDIWVQLAGQSLSAIKDFSWVPIAVTAYNMVFGNKKKGMDGVVDLQTRQKIWDIVLERMKSRDASRAVKNMGVIQPNKDVRDLEEGDKDSSE